MEETEEIESYEMPSRVQDLFEYILSQKNLDHAIDYLNINISQVPEASIINAVIYQILMKTTNVSTASNALQYLMTQLKVHPPQTADDVKYYYQAMRGNNLWDNLSRIVVSCFCATRVYENLEEPRVELIPSPNCEFLLHFYTQVFMVEFNLSLTRVDIHGPVRQNFAKKLFWPSGINYSITSNGICLLKWINEIYEGVITQEKFEILRNLHKLLSLMVNCFQCCGNEVETDHVASSAMNDLILFDLMNHIVRECPNVVKNHENLKTLLADIDLRWFRVKLCESIIYNILHLSRNTPESRILTLRNIVGKLMFVRKWGRRRQLNVKSKKYKSLSSLHVACKDNDCEAVSKALNNPSINLSYKDNSGLTLLHTACLYDNYECAKILIKGSNGASTSTNAPVDPYVLSDNNELPLHCAIKVNSMSIAKMLMEKQGALLCLKRGQTNAAFICLAKTPEMKQLIELHTVSNTERDFAKEETRSLETYRDYSIYLHCLNFLLCDYCEIFRLSKLTNQLHKWGVGSRRKVTKFLEKHVYGHATDDDVMMCYDDLLVYRMLSDVIPPFVESIEKNARTQELDMSLEVLPLKLFAATL